MMIYSRMSIAVVMLGHSFLLFSMERKEQISSYFVQDDLVKLYGFTYGHGYKKERIFDLNYNKKRVYTNYYGTLSSFNIDDKEKRLVIHAPEKRRALMLALALGEDTAAYSYKSVLTGQNAFGLGLDFEKKLYLYDLYKKTVRRVSCSAEKQKFEGIDAICVSNDSTKALLGSGKQIGLYTLPDFTLVQTYAREPYNEGTVEGLFFTRSSEIISVEKNILFDQSTEIMVVLWNKEPQTFCTDLIDLMIKPVFISNEKKSQILLVGKNTNQEIVLRRVETDEQKKICMRKFYISPHIVSVVAAGVDEEGKRIALFTNQKTMEFDYKPVIVFIEVKDHHSKDVYITYEASNAHITDLTDALMYFKGADLHVIYNNGTEQKICVGY